MIVFFWLFIGLIIGIVMGNLLVLWMTSSIESQNEILR